MKFEKLYSTIDTHVEGEVFRIVVQSPIVFEEPDLERNHKKLRSSFTQTKNLLLNEPRGHRGINGCIILPSKKADFAVLFFNHECTNNFKYEALIATITGLLETDNIPKQSSNIYQIETVFGIFELQALMKEGIVITTLKVAPKIDIEKIDDYYIITFDQDRTYMVFNKSVESPNIELLNLAALSKWGKEKTKILSSINMDGVILVDDLEENSRYKRSITFEKDGYILRSPGLDTTIALATLSSEKQITNTSIFDSKFTVLHDEGYSITTKAYVTGVHQFIFDKEDPLENGFILV